MSPGFSLVEVLVALVVLSIGLLGAAALLLGGGRDQTSAAHQAALTLLVADVAERIRANPLGRELYDTRTARDAPADCSEAAPCGAAALAARDLAHFSSAAQALLPSRAPRTRVSFEPATGPAAADRYVISVAWNDARDPDATDETTTLILLAWPVAGAP